MTSEEIAYVAGLLEGEGCFDFNRTPKYVRVRIEMTDIDVITHLQSLTGGRVSLPVNRKPSEWKDTALLTINGKEAVDLMKAVRPWLGKRRRKKVDTLLEGRAQQ